MNSPRIGWTLITALLLISGFGLPATLAGQDPLSVGDRIQLSTTDSPIPLEGEVAEMSRDGLVLAVSDSVFRRVRMSEIWSVARHSREGEFWKTLLKVEAIGTIGTAIITGITYEPCRSWLCIGPQSRGEAFVWGAAVGALASLPVGAVIGAVAKQDRWTRLDPQSLAGRIEDRVRLEVARSATGLSLGATIMVGGGS